MGATDVKRQAPNVARMKMLGADVIPVTSGSSTLKDATREAMRDLPIIQLIYYIVGSVVGPSFLTWLLDFSQLFQKRLKSNFF